nr:hypothetical protein [Tanacetum cinerariifolium]
NPSRPFSSKIMGLPAWHFKEVVGVGRGCFAVQRYGKRVNPSRPFSSKIVGLPAWHFKEVVGVGRGCFAVQRYGKRGGKKLRLIWAGRAVHS